MVRRESKPAPASLPLILESKTMTGEEMNSEKYDVKQTDNLKITNRLTLVQESDTMTGDQKEEECKHVSNTNKTIKQEITATLLWTLNDKYTQLYDSYRGKLSASGKYNTIAITCNQGQS